MRIHYNLTGAERKSLVGAISQVLNAPTKYLGAPSFAYEVGGYHIDKHGTLTGPDSLDLEADLQGLHGFEAVERTYDEPDTYESGLDGMGAFESPQELGANNEKLLDGDQHHPGQYANPNAAITETMQRQLDGVLTFEDLRIDGREEFGLGSTRRENPQGENGMQASDVPKPDTLAIEMPLTGFTPEKLENLFKLVNAKAPLLKAALNADDLPIQQIDEDGGKLVFPWFTVNADGDAVRAYTMLIERLCAAAKEQHRVTAKVKNVENEKFAFRVFLIRLGFVGDEYKAARKILLKNLSGNSAFKNGAPPKTTEVPADE